MVTLQRQIAFLIVVSALSACSIDQSLLTEVELESRARSIHNAVLTFDSEVDIPFNFATDEIDPGTRTELQVDLVKMHEGGLDAAAFVIWVRQEARTPKAYATAIEQGRAKLDAIHRMAVQYPDEIEIAYSANDFERLHAEGKLVALIGMVNGYALGPDLSLLKDYYDQGLRYISFTHAGHNDLADSSRPQIRLGNRATEHGGLSDLGRALVAEMNRLGIIVDVSQVTMEALEQIASVSKAPIIASHSSIHTLVPNPRNITDDGLLAIKDTGGVIQIVAFSGYIIDNSELFNAELALLNKEYGLEPGQTVEDLPTDRQEAYGTDQIGLFAKMPDATVAQYVNHIDYAVELLGIDHVGISSDFEHGGGVIGWMDASETFNVTKELVRRGYTEQGIAKIWNGNFLRVLKDVEQVAATLARMTK